MLEYVSFSALQHELFVGQVLVARSLPIIVSRNGDERHVGPSNGPTRNGQRCHGTQVPASTQYWCTDLGRDLWAVDQPIAYRRLGHGRLSRRNHRVGRATGLRAKELLLQGQRAAPTRVRVVLRAACGERRTTVFAGSLRAFAGDTAACFYCTCVHMPL